MSLGDIVWPWSTDFKLDWLCWLTGFFFKLFHPNDLHLDVPLTAGNQKVWPVKNHHGYCQNHAIIRHRWSSYRIWLSMTSLLRSTSLRFSFTSNSQIPTETCNNTLYVHPLMPLRLVRDLHERQVCMLTSEVGSQTVALSLVAQAESTTSVALLTDRAGHHVSLSPAPAE